MQRPSYYQEEVVLGLVWKQFFNYGSLQRRPSYGLLLLATASQSISAHFQKKMLGNILVFWSKVLQIIR